MRKELTICTYYDKVYSCQGKYRPFVRPLMYVYNTAEDARKGGRNWEHYERKRKRNKKKKKIPK